MPDHVTIQAIALAGFRAYLQEQRFDLQRDNSALSLAILAPNAKGKSSLVDAIEFYFSQNGTLQRLGERSLGTKVGRQPLEHVKANEVGISPHVSIWFREGRETYGDRRDVGIQNPQPLTPSAARVLGLVKHDFIVRGYELRSFVESRSPEERYADVSRWFGLESLVATQRNLRAIRRRVKESVERDSLLETRLADLRSATSGALHEWNEASVCAWFERTFLASLQPKLSLGALDRATPQYAAIQKAKSKEDGSVGLAVLNQLLPALAAVIVKTNVARVGALANFEHSVAKTEKAVELEVGERGKAAQALFSELWQQALSVLADDTQQITACPVCTTPFSVTPKGSRDAIKLHLTTELGKLTGYATARSAMLSAKADSSNARASLSAALSVLAGLLRAAQEEAAANVIQSYEDALRPWKPSNPVPDSAPVVDVIAHLTPIIKARRDEIVASQGERTFAKALAKLDSLVEIKENILLATSIRTEREKLRASLEDAAATISHHISSQVEGMLGQLTSSLNRYYAAIQQSGGGDPVPYVRLRLPEPDDKAQQRLDLLFDFAPNRKDVNPTGYLSDSQIHALALSLRLAAIRLFNKGLPMAVLDDVVTSYDADHRKCIAAMLAEHFHDVQLIIATHDELFFNFLKEHLPRGRWLYKRIAELEPDYGPKYSDHRIADEHIEEMLAKGKSAANEIRQAEEEWLLNICRAFGVDVRIRRHDRPYEYERAELAEGLGKFLRDKRLTPPRIQGHANPFIDSLRTGTVENFGSHFTDNPGAFLSVGDQKVRWDEFRRFRDAFRCPVCGKRRFHRPRGSRLPLCEGANCGASFAFK